MPRKPPNDTSDPDIIDLGALAGKRNFDSYYTHPYTGEPDIPFFNFLSGKGNQSALVVVGSENSEDIIMSAHDDLADMGGGDDIAVGGPGNDTISGGDGRDFIFGDTDLGLGDVAWKLDDVLNGDAGDDLIVGDSPNLFETAAGGDDTLNGGTGNDTLWGDGVLWDEASGGADWFVFGSADGNDVIMDFHTADGDKIVLDDEMAWIILAASKNGSLDESDTFVQIVDGSTLIDLGEASGSGAGEHTLLVEGVVGLGFDDFLFV
ncbi:calcium-binding protein [Silicimonas sp. MF1-12-2]|uniref:calcium-binding protein n=1 Tax=Silicimonas sp. MF1-12-2 TaxID=3384793 RepID=UPI0039B5196D